MHLTIPKALKPVLVAAAIVGAAYAAAFLLDLYDVGGRERCCATEFDATPFERTPASRP